MTVEKGGRILYVSYDGVLEPLGDSQVLQYLEELAKYYEIYLVSFEKRNDWKDEERRRSVELRMQTSGIHWAPQKYTKSPAVISTIYDMTKGLLSSWALVVRYKLELVHARSYVAALIARALKFSTGTGFIFDMRGFWPDERVNAGQWSSESRAYKLTKRLEKTFLSTADATISLTHAASHEIRSRSDLKVLDPVVDVIPTCVNRSLFRPKGSNTGANLVSSSGIEFVLGCVGSVDGWFRFDAVLDFFEILVKENPSSRLIVLNRGQHSLITNLIKKKGISRCLIDVEYAEFEKVPEKMALMNAGIFFYQPSFSELARCPTKMAEFLACGVPCVTNAGIGDCDKILSASATGVVVPDFGDKSLARGAQDILDLTRQDSIRDRCVKAAEKYFSLEQGIASYRQVYDRVLDKVRD